MPLIKEPMSIIEGLLWFILGYNVLFVVLIFNCSEKEQFQKDQLEISLIRLENS